MRWGFPVTIEEDLRGVQVIRAETLEPNSVISKIEVNPARIRPINPNAYVPNFIIPVRLYANPEQARGDKFWETYFKGGVFGDTVFATLIDQTTVFYDTEVSFYHPYSYRETIDLKDDFTSVSPSIWKIQSNYNDYDQYVQKYQDWSSSKHELLLPNLNFAICSFVDTASMGS